MSDVCLVFFRSDHADLEKAAAVLTDRRMTVQRQDDHLDVTFPGSPLFQIGMAVGEHVRVEAEELAASNAYARSKLPCDARFEILIEDLDEALDEMNTLIEIQLELEKLTDGFVFNCWNSELIGNAAD